MDDKEIRDLFAKYEVPLGRKDVWAVQGTPVIKHSALERLSAAIGLTWDTPTAVISTMQDVVILARATRKDGISEWSYGEASIVRDGSVGGNYKVSGKQAAYPWAMAEKRAKDRVIIKLAGLYGAYSSDEAADFDDPEKKTYADGSGEPARGRRRANRQEADERPEPLPEVSVGESQEGGRAVADPEPEPREELAPREEPAPREERAPEPAKPATRRRAPEPEPQGDAEPANDAESEEVRQLRENIKKCRTINAVTDLMLAAETQAVLGAASATLRNELRDAGKERLKALGWPGNSKAA